MGHAAPPIQINQALRVLKRLFRRFFRRAARFLWCRFFDTARSMPEVASRYASVAPVRSLALTSFRNFLMEVRKDERWLMLWTRRWTPWRARFRAWGELAKIVLRVDASFKGRQSLPSFSPKVKFACPAFIFMASPCCVVRRRVAAHILNVCCASPLLARLA